MKWILSLLAISSIFGQSSLTNDALFSLQQLRTVIPERLWEQEFSILVDEKAFEAEAKKMSHRRREETIQPSFSVAQSREYFLFATMSGETIRLLDRYQELEEGVFWRKPFLMDKLEWMEE